MKFEVSENLTHLKGDRIMDIEVVEKGEINLVCNSSFKRFPSAKESPSEM